MELTAQIAVFKSTDPEAANRIVNTLHFSTDLVQLVDADLDELADDLAATFSEYRTYPAGWNRVNVKLYDKSDPIPRPILRNRTVSMSPGTSECGPREVALCLSFYADRNLPRRRGRIYTGPWTMVGQGERPSQEVINLLEQLALGISNAGNADVDWVVFSGTDQESNEVTNYWIDNEWDTVRSRGLKGTTRLQGTIDE